MLNVRLVNMNGETFDPEDATTEEQILQTLGMIYAELATIRESMEGQSPQSNTESIECRVCGSVFDSEGKFREHAKRKHGAVNGEMANGLKA